MCTHSNPLHLFDAHVRAGNCSSKLNVDSLAVGIILCAKCKYLRRFVTFKAKYTTVRYKLCAEENASQMLMKIHNSSIRRH